jgi:uncharacterized membrane protein
MEMREKLIVLGDRITSIFFWVGCHQIPDRCFMFRGRPMPFCARCLGCAVGQVIAVVSAIMFSFLPYWVYFMCLTIMLIDWYIQEYLGVFSTNIRRLFTGIVGGFGFSCALFKTVLFAFRLFY